MRLIGSFQTITTHGCSCSNPSSDEGSRISTSAGATVVLARLIAANGRSAAGLGRSTERKQTPNQPAAMITELVFGSPARFEAVVVRVEVTGRLRPLGLLRLITAPLFRAHLPRHRRFPPRRATGRAWR